MIDENQSEDVDHALAERVDALGAALVKKRDEAISARRESGIEEEWRAAEDAYQGVDDHNRGDSPMAKPVSPDGGVSAVRSSASKMTRSTVVLNITRPYVDAASARVGDMLLPTDDSPWAIRPTPKPMMPGFAKQQPVAGAAQQMMQAPPVPQGAPQMPPGMPSAPPEMGPGMPGQPAMVPPALPGVPGQAAPAGQPNEITAPDDDQAAKVSAEGATKQIEDWLVQCQWHTEVRKLIDDAARLGTGVLKGPTPRKMRRKAVSLESGNAMFELVETIEPESRAISPWNVYPDMACGDDVRDGGYIWEHDTLTAKGLRDLKGLGYLDDQIDLALEEGPQSSSDSARRTERAKVSDKTLFDVWYFHGTVERDDLQAAGVDVPDEGDVAASAIVTMVNGRVIKAALNPLESGEFPYDFMPWQRKDGLPFGTGVAMQINVPQRMLTAGTRNLLDNAGLSAGPQIVLRRGAIVPSDGKWEITPRKIWFVQDGSDVMDVEKAFQVFNIPTMQVELMNIIQFAMKMAEDVTGLPAMMQGQGTNAPETVGGMQMLQNNAGTVLRRIARLFDDKITEPHIRRYYEWLLLFGEDDAIKGDFQIDARGSTALVERDMQTQAIVQMGVLVANPNFGIDPEKWFVEMLKSQRLDPKRFTLDDDKKAAMAQQPPPVAPQIEAAKIRAEADAQKTQATLAAKAQAEQIAAQVKMQIAEIVRDTSVEKMRLDTDRDRAYVESQARRDQTMSDAKLQELQLKRDLAMLEYSKTNKVTLDKIKADLAKKAMEINATKELAGMKVPADMLPKPPVEPPQQAKPGESYQQ